MNRYRQALARQRDAETQANQLADVLDWLVTRVLTDEQVSAVSARLADPGAAGDHDCHTDAPPG